MSSPVRCTVGSGARSMVACSAVGPLGVRLVIGEAALAFTGHQPVRDALRVDGRYADLLRVVLQRLEPRCEGRGAVPRLVVADRRSSSRCSRPAVTRGRRFRSPFATGYRIRLNRPSRVKFGQCRVRVRGLAPLGQQPTGPARRSSRPACSRAEVVLVACNSPTPRWRPRTASSDSSSFRTCSPPSRRSLRFAPSPRSSGLDAVSARAPPRATVRRRRTPIPCGEDDLAQRCPTSHAHCAAVDRDSTHRLESPPRSHHPAAPTASKPRPTWTEAAPEPDPPQRMRRGFCLERPQENLRFSGPMAVPPSHPLSGVAPG